MERIEWAVGRLRPHPENSAIFGDPEEDDAFEGMVTSIRNDGIFDDLLIKSDGTIVCGHLRYAAAQKLGLKHVPIRVVGPFKSYADELRMLVLSNVERRRLSPAQLAAAYKRLRETPRATGGTKGQKGGGTKGKRGAPNQSGSRTGLEARDEAAATLGVGVNEARSLETVFHTPGVPDELKAAVNTGKVKPTPAARAVREEVRRQGGAISNSEPLRAAAVPPKRTPHEAHVATEAEAYAKDYRELFDAYKAIDKLLNRRPLPTVLGATEHHEYMGLIRDFSLRLWREIEAAHGPSDTGKQMRLVALDGGKR